MPITWPQVGAIEFITLGEPTSIAEESEVITRANVDGVAIRKGATRGQAMVLEGTRDIAAASAAALKTALDSYKALQGTTVTIITDTGVTRTNMYIQRVTIPIGGVRRIAATAGGIEPAGTATYVAKVRFLVIDTN
jgi:hypothetical protein